MKLATTLLAAASMLVSGCTTPIIKELRHPGGYPGHLLDKRMIDSSQSKSVQLLRAAMIVAMASRMATATIRDGSDGDAFAEYLAAASEELNFTASSLYAVDSTQPCAVNGAEAVAACPAYSVNFEADVPLLEARIVRLMLAALPENRAREFLEDVGKGDVMGAAWGAIRAATETANGLRRSAAVYRSNLELAAVLKGCAFDQTTDTVKKAASTCFNLPENELFTDRRIEITGQVNRHAFHSIMLMARTACARLPLNTEGNLGEKATRRNALCADVVFRPANRPTAIPTA